VNIRARRPIKPVISKPKPKVAAPRDAIVSLLDKTLRTAEIDDRSINGLQVEGAAEVSKIGLAVDACLEAYRMAHALGCQMVIAHHGIIWDGLKSVRGQLFRQIEFLVKSGLNLYASHLPLDLHPTLGNNAQIARALGLRGLCPFGMYRGGNIGVEGAFPRPTTLKAVSDALKKLYGGPVSSLPFGPQKFRSAAVISGGGTAALPEAIEKNLDLFITGEPSHENHHLALEGKINVVYGGHYHTEKPGVMALGEFLKKKFGVETAFLDVPTLV
jgi:dinuclear metal center YbgI/SA1388 family protein